MSHSFRKPRRTASIRDRQHLGGPINPLALCAVQAVLFLILLNVLLVLGAAHSAALLLAWLGSAPALLVVLAVALPTGRSPRPA